MADNLKYDKLIDIKKDVCPYTFIKAKLEIEEMKTGQVLKVMVGNPLSAEDVPRGMELEGHKILKIEKISETEWQIWIQKQ